MQGRKFVINTATGLLSNARYVASPNHDQRPESTNIDLLVIHNISLPPNEFGGDDIEKLFLNQLDANAHPFYETIKDLKVSAHLLIRRNGAITQFVPFHLRAWHAGKSFFKGRSSCNDFSIGIELEGADHIPYTTEQYETLVKITGELIFCYPSMSFDRIVGHHTIAPDRKTDPGPAFDWIYYHELLEKEISI